MSKLVDLSDLPEEIVDEIIVNRLSKVELLRVRSISKNWRSAVGINKPFPKRDNRNRKRFLSSYKTGQTCLLSPAAFFRVIQSSCPNKGWLIKTEDVTETTKKLLSPLTRLPVDFSHQTLDLLDYTVSEIHQSYDVHGYDNNLSKFTSYDFARVVLVNNLVFGVDYFNKIWWCNGGEFDNDNAWTRISDEEAEYFSDIIVHKGQVYALDLKGSVWWISLTELNIFQYAPPTPMEYYEVDDCKDKKLVEFGGDLCIVHRFCKRFRVGALANVERTIGFKVYKMDKELVEWVQVTSLGDKAFVMATDSFFSVLASEYYGCLEDSIYFTDEEDKNNVKVFKLGDGSITKMVERPYLQSCFHMFYPPFM